MEFEIIPGFSALKFKEEAQARVQADLEGLSPEERLRHIRESVEKGPFADFWRRIQPSGHREIAPAEPKEPVSMP